MPLGLNLYDEDLRQEKQQMHFGLFDPSEHLIACIIAVTLSSSAAKLRQMAVHHEHQGKGHGRNLIHCLENHLARSGFTHLFLYARMTAVGFYEKLGYAKVGNEFMEVEIPHIRMEKGIQPSNTNDTEQTPG